MSSILIIGESGSGKSTSIRNLDPKSTFIINASNKPLPFKGWAKLFGKNILATDNASTISSTIRKIDKENQEITTIVIDDFQAVMTNDYMRNSMEKGFEKFVRLGKGIWEIVTAANNSRNSLKVILMAHSDTDQNGKIKCKTVGKLIDEKISLEGMCTIVFHSKALEGKYVFLTQNDGVSIAKSPMGMFDSQKIENDLDKIIKIIDAYYIGEEPEDTEKDDSKKQDYLDEISLCNDTKAMTYLCKKAKEEFPLDKEFYSILVKAYKSREKSLLEEKGRREFINELDADQRPNSPEIENYEDKHGK